MFPALFEYYQPRRSRGKRRGSYTCAEALYLRTSARIPATAHITNPIGAANIAASATYVPASVDGPDTPFCSNPNASAEIMNIQSPHLKSRDT